MMKDTLTAHPSVIPSPSLVIPISITVPVISTFFVIPAPASARAGSDGIHTDCEIGVDPRLRGDDKRGGGDDRKKSGDDKGTKRQVMIKMSIGFLAVFLTTLTAFASPTLPSNIKWETHTADPVFASPHAKDGGFIKTYMTAYPLTFRLYGPNSNQLFANYNNATCEMGLVGRHPYTLNPIPMLATHWAVMKDQQTIYYKLDPDAKWRDGKPVTADDYIFAYEMMLSPHIKDPFANKYFRERFQSVEKIDTTTLKITGAYPSWRALWEFQISPQPKHTTVLDEQWVKRANWDIPMCVGPYYISGYKEGRYVRMKLVSNWWGSTKKYLKGTTNFEVVDYKIIRDDRLALEHFKKGKLSYYQVNTASWWATDTNFEAVQKGWVVKRRIHVKHPSGIYGMMMNTAHPTMKNKYFRKAIQHLFDFDKINKNLMYNAYTRLNSFFTGTEYENPNLGSYPYDPQKASALLKKAGWTKRGEDGILVNNAGERCSFVLTYGSGGLTRHLSVYVEDLKSAGVEMKLRLVDDAKSFKDAREKNFQALLVAMTSGLYPSAEEFLHSDYAQSPNNNNFFSFASAEADRLLEIYKTQLDLKKRQAAMFKLDEIIKDEAFYLPFWTGNYVRVLYWNNLGHIDDYEPLYALRSTSFNLYGTWWFDAEKDALLKAAQKKDQPIPHVNDSVDVGPALFHTGAPR